MGIASQTGFGPIPLPNPRPIPAIKQDIASSTKQLEVTEARSNGTSPAIQEQLDHLRELNFELGWASVLQAHKGAGGQRTSTGETPGMSHGGGGSRRAE